MPCSANAFSTRQHGPNFPGVEQRWSFNCTTPPYSWYLVASSPLSPGETGGTVGRGARATDSGGRPYTPTRHATSSPRASGERSSDIPAHNWLQACNETRLSLFILRGGLV